MELRKYQQEAAEAVLNHWSIGNRKNYISLPTGSGKTVVAADLVQRLALESQNVLVLAHRDELVQQAYDKIFRYADIKAGIEKGTSRANRYDGPVIIGSVQSMQAGRLLEYHQNRFQVIIVDECHHTLADTYQNILQYFSGALVMGMTATPDRGDGKSLLRYYNSRSYSKGFMELVAEGVLVKPISVKTRLEIDVTKAGRDKNGDLKEAGIAAALEPYLEQIADIVAAEYANRKTVVFLPLVGTSKRFTELLLERGLKATHIDGSFPKEKRKKILSDYESCKSGILCNAMLLTEGWDCPSVDCVIILRPTTIRSLYAQMLGRGTRVAEGKKDLLVPDFLWMCDDSKLCVPDDILEEPEEEDLEIMMIAGVNMLDLNDSVEEEKEDSEPEEPGVSAQELKLVSAIERIAKGVSERSRSSRQLSTVSPHTFYKSLGSGLTEWTAAGRAGEPASDEQLDGLRIMGIKPQTVRTAAQAQMLLQLLVIRQEKGLATPYQLKELREKGYGKAELFTKAQAIKEISYIRKRGAGRPGRAQYLPGPSAPIDMFTEEF